MIGTREPKSKQRDLFLEFIKGVGILCVLIIHTLHPESPVFIWMAVPLFVLLIMVQAYHAYGGYRPSVIKLFRRILFPFLCIQSLYLLYQACCYEVDWDYLKNFLVLGGMGSGSYYVWIYLQATLILPAILYFTNHFVLWKSALILIGISVFLDLFCCLTDFPEWLYRLLCFRYVFLLYLGCLWRKYNFSLNMIWFLLAGISVLFIYLERILYIDFHPFIPAMWSGNHWIDYFYTVFLLLILKIVYPFIRNTVYARMIVYAGNHSYAIFLFQMLYFYFLYSKVKSILAGFNGEAVVSNLYFLCLINIVFCVSFVWVIRYPIQKCSRI